MTKFVKITDIDEANKLIRKLLSDKARLLKQVTCLKNKDNIVIEELTLLASEVPYLDERVQAIINNLKGVEFTDADDVFAFLLSQGAGNGG